MNKVLWVILALLCILFWMIVTLSYKNLDNKLSYIIDRIEWAEVTSN